MNWRKEVALTMTEEKKQTAPQEMSAEEVMKKYDKESDKRNPVGAWHYIISGICILFACFQLYTAIFGVLDAHLQRTIHLMFGLTLIFLLYPGRKSWSRSSMNPIDVICALLGIGTTGYLLLNYQELVLRAGLNTQTDIIVGIIGVLMVFEATRRTVGWPMLTVALIFVAYAFLGPYMPGILAHRGVGFDELVSHLFFTTEGIFGVPMGVSSTFIYLFILFGAYLDATGLGKFFIDMANALAGWAIGGPAKVAVLSSGLMGTVSGSSVANVAGTGSFTIPMMKKLGYPTLFCNSLEVADDGEITGFKMRVEQSKLTTVKALQSIGFETIASGDSYNDLGMIQASKAGFLFRSTDKIKADYPQIPAYETYEELLGAIKKAMDEK